VEGSFTLERIGTDFEIPGNFTPSSSSLVYNTETPRSFDFHCRGHFSLQSKSQYHLLPQTQFTTTHCSPETTKMPRNLSILSVLLFLLSISVVNAQFQFFEQMFQGGQQQQRQEPQNVPSDSSWYQQNYDQGTSLLPSSQLLTALTWNQRWELS
jgi:hypothetical protein